MPKRTTKNNQFSVDGLRAEVDSLHQQFNRITQAIREGRVDLEPTTLRRLQRAIKNL